MTDGVFRFLDKGAAELFTEGMVQGSKFQNRVSKTQLFASFCKIHHNRQVVAESAKVAWPLVGAVGDGDAELCVCGEQEG